MGTQKYNPQKEYIEKVKTIAINPLKVANSYFKQETNTYSPGKRVSVGTYTLNDYITVASNQIVFELDARAYNTNYKLAKQIIEVLDDRGYPYYVFSTGGKGIHIECWFDKPKFTSNKTKRMFKKALSYNISFKDIRFWLWNEILNDAGIRNDIRGIGKTVDSSCLSFDDLNDKSRLLRIAGGRKHIQKLEIDDKLTFYKTHIPITEFNARKINLTAFDKVKYPSKLEAFNINETEFLAFLNNFITKSEALHVEQLKKVDLSTKNGYIGLESVKRILEGLAPGQRSLGAQILAIAMSNDNLTIAQQNTIME
nr:hypothetical protein [Bacteroidota bacterium]